MNALDATTGDPRDTSMGYLMNEGVASDLRGTLARQGWAFERAEQRTRTFMGQQAAREMGLAGCTHCGAALTCWPGMGAWPTCITCEDRTRLERHVDADYGPYLADALFDAYVERLREVARPGR